jgi:hypothetical protein
MEVGIDADGIARFHAVRPTSRSSVSRLTLDCSTPNGEARSYPIDLRSEATFAPHPFDPHRANLPPRAALEGDPLSFTQAELLDRGYGLRPDPTQNAAAYGRWLATARRPAYKLVSGRRPTVAPPAPSAGTGTRHVENSINYTTEQWWTGSKLTGSFSQGPDAAHSQIYSWAEASFTIPSATIGAYGTVGTRDSFWVGMGESATQLVQVEVNMQTDSTTAAYSISSQFFPALVPNPVASTRGEFTPQAGDNIYFEVWYCDANGNENTSGGYACTYMTAARGSTTLTWECDKANPANNGCASCPLNSADTYSGNVGTTAEFVLEEQNGQGYGLGGLSSAPYPDGPWPAFTAPVTMTGSAHVVLGDNTNVQWTTVETDPSVSVLTDFFPATNPNHLTVSIGSPNATVWSVGAQPPNGSLSIGCQDEYFPAGFGLQPWNTYHSIATISATGSQTLPAMQEWNGSDWVDLSQFVMNAEYPSSATPGVFAIGEQFSGQTLSGAPIGSTQTVRACAQTGSNPSCATPVDLTIPNCCVPLTCDGYSCGKMSNGCGGQMTCGCDSGGTCNQGKCSYPSNCKKVIHCPKGSVWDPVNCDCESLN